MTRYTNPWLKVGFDAMALGMEAASVIGLRSAKIALGGPSADAEAKLMVEEKINAAWALQTLALTGALGVTAPRIVGRTLTHYRRKVHANQRRLSK